LDGSTTNTGINRNVNERRIDRKQPRKERAGAAAAGESLYSQERLAFFD